jgi:hypothetical protein
MYNNRTFAAGAGAIATNFFCLFGFIFLVTQYFQLVRGYSALSAGVHTLPFAFAVMVTTPLGALAALRLGTRYVVTMGLLLTAAALYWMSLLSSTVAYIGPIVGSMLTLSVGFSLVNAPSVAATMETLVPEQIGGGAAGNETTRELGGTMGVAIFGSVFASLFGPDIRRAFAPFLGRGLTAAQIRVAQSSMQAAKQAVKHFAPALQVHLDDKVTAAFMDGLHRACLVGGGIAVVVAIVVFRYLPTGRAPSDSELVLEH